MFELTGLAAQISGAELKARSQPQERRLLAHRTRTCCSAEYKIHDA